MSNANNPKVVVYGSADCPFTKRVRQWLDNWDVGYRWVDVDKDSAAEKQIADWNDGRAIRPTLDVNGEILVNPEHGVLEQTLKSRDLLKSPGA